MEGVCAPAARACHADNVHILPVETPRTFGTLTTHYVSRRRCVTASMHCNAHCAAAAALRVINQADAPNDSLPPPLPPPSVVKPSPRPLDESSIGARVIARRRGISVGAARVESYLASLEH